MAFTHQRTFLRSALAKDPFALGDLGPEDVLRIESEFPDLFRPTANSRTDAELAESNVPKTNNATNPKRHFQGAVAPPPEKYLRPSQLPSAVKKGLSVDKTSPYLQANNQTNVPFSPKRNINRRSPINTRMTTLSSSLAKPQLVSVEELRKVLKEILEDEKRRMEYTLTTPKNNKRVKDMLNKARSPDYNNLKKLIQQEYIQKNVDLISRQESRKTLASSEKGLPTKVSQVELQESSKIRNNTETTAVPGFLRPGMPKRSAPIVQPKPSKVVKFQTSGKFIPANITPQNNEKSPEKEENIKHNSEERNLKVRITTHRDKSQIHIKGTNKEKDFEPQYDTENAVKDTNVKDDPFLSYQQLKLTSNLATKYEKIGLLKKKIPQHPSQSSTSLKSSDYNQNPKTHFETQASIIDKNIPTPSGHNNILETIAKELVYAEILKHLNDIKTQTSEEHEENQRNDEEGCSNSFEKTQINQQQERKETNCKLDVIEEISENSLKTPSLSKSSKPIVKTPSPQKGVKFITSPQLEFSTPDTPDLSLSIVSKRGNYAVKDSPGNINDATDCSEISDFVFSEKETSTPKRNVQKSQSSSSNLGTPQISKTSSPRKNLHKQTRSKNDSIFQNSKRSSKQPTSPETPKKLSTTFPENFQEYHHIPMESNDTLVNLTPIPNSKFDTLEGVDSKDIIFEEVCSSAEKDVDDDSKSQSMFGLLSEGEFIGGVYKSPGEVSQSHVLKPNSSVYGISSDNSTSKGSTVYYISASTSKTNHISSSSQIVVPEGISLGEYLGGLSLST